MLRILHSLVLTEEGRFSGACSQCDSETVAPFCFLESPAPGRPQFSRLAPPDVTVLTDEISYVRKCDGVYRAFGTPFAGELARIGENVAAPIAALFFLDKGPANSRESR